jgi:hypothetical protein
LPTTPEKRSPISFNSKGETLFQKSISIVPITLESERHISTICTILNVDEYWCQFDNNALKFATIPGPIKDGGMLNYFYFYKLTFAQPNHQDLHHLQKKSTTIFITK